MTSVTSISIGSSPSVLQKQEEALSLITDQAQLNKETRGSNLNIATEHGKKALDQIANLAGAMSEGNSYAKDIAQIRAGNGETTQIQTKEIDDYVSKTLSTITKPHQKTIEIITSNETIFKNHFNDQLREAQSLWNAFMNVNTEHIENLKRLLNLKQGQEKHDLQMEIDRKKIELKEREVEFNETIETKKADNEARHQQYMEQTEMRKLQSQMQVERNAIDLKRMGMELDAEHEKNKLKLKQWESSEEEFSKRLKGYDGDFKMEGADGITREAKDYRRKEDK